ncbi:hypothetical protein ACFQ5J_02415 [Lacticaseibacillus baoqingensis]|uniref:Uncharacterized protein n=2 Tax=Lacticaseibacillus baoqingensis TaxID=2486013 RepID=A0ABW4E6L1_9LACO
MSHLSRFLLRLIPLLAGMWVAMAPQPAHAATVNNFSAQAVLPSDKPAVNRILT